MSSDRAFREWRFYIDDMIDFAHKAQTYTSGMSREQFVGDSLVYDATLRNLELIGEAATRIPDWARARYDKVPWRMIIATRNKLIHAYLGIDDDTVWSIIRDELPELMVQLDYVAATFDE